MEVIKNSYGYYELKNKPSQEELEKYYADKYYQHGLATHKNEYSETDLNYLNNKIAQKYSLVEERFEYIKAPALLDVGCGEGYSLKFFSEKGWKVQGLDYSEHGIKNHNPDCIDYFTAGDIYENIEQILDRKEKFDVIWLDNVLEHVLDPLELLKKCYSLGNEDALMIIEVPNDFSKVQEVLKQESLIEKDYWIAIPDHISYFNLDGLSRLSVEANWVLFDSISDFPIEFNLFNPNSNYVNDKSKGKGAHQQRLKVENLMNNISLEKTVEIYRLMADMGIGRQIVGVFSKA